MRALRRVLAALGALCLVAALAFFLLDVEIFRSVVVLTIIASATGLLLLVPYAVEVLSNTTRGRQRTIQGGLTARFARLGDATVKVLGPDRGGVRVEFSDGRRQTVPARTLRPVDE